MLYGLYQADEPHQNGYNNSRFSCYDLACDRHFVAHIIMIWNYVLLFFPVMKVIDGVKLADSNFYSFIMALINMFI